MKRLLLGFLLVSACGGAVHKPDAGSEKLKEMDIIAENCRRVYIINVEGWANNQEDAMTYLKNRVIDDGRGNAFQVREMNQSEKRWWHWFYRRTYFEVKANIYNCN